MPSRVTGGRVTVNRPEKQAIDSHCGEEQGGPEQVSNRKKGERFKQCPERQTQRKGNRKSVSAGEGVTVNRATGASGGWRVVALIWGQTDKQHEQGRWGWASSTGQENKALLGVRWPYWTTVFKWINLISSVIIKIWNIAETTEYSQATTRALTFTISKCLKKTHWFQGNWWGEQNLRLEFF